MKRWSPIGLLLVLAGLWSCAKPSVVPVSQELAAIDTLMQSRPDSALMLLVDTTMDDPYYQLLLSEALYKNDNPQLNRFELLEAMAWYDSVVESHPYDQTTVFLDARCHYMNGVGYYEKDSVVMACAEYMEAVEIMEGRFEEQELTGYKAMFMALTYTRLADLFSHQYLHKQAVLFGKLSLKYYPRHSTTLQHISWTLNNIAIHYNILGQLDSADYYYCKAMEVLPDTNTLTYRDIAAARASLSYQRECTAQESLSQLQRLAAQSESEKEFLSRYAVLGEIYYREKLFDSAWCCLDTVFKGNSSVASKRQAAEWLVEIGSSQGMNTAQYADFLVPFANLEENESELKSQLAEYYSNYIQKEQIRRHRNETVRRIIQMSLVIGCGTVLLTVYLWILKRKKHSLEIQIEKERHVHAEKQKALGGRLKQSNSALRKQKKENTALQEKLDEQQRRSQWGDLDVFMNEAVCREILNSLDGKTIKREIKSDAYPDCWLKDTQLSQLEMAVERHFPGFSNTLTMHYPKIGREEMNQCFLCLLNLKDVQIAVLLHCDYSTIRKRSIKMQTVFQTKKDLQRFVRDLVQRF